MAISLLSKAAGNPTFDQVFAPYVMGTSPPATGLLDDSGVDTATRYAPIIYGTMAPATGMLTQAAGNADVNTLWAAYGTAVYTLPINGVTYSAICSIPAGGNGYSSVTFGFTSTTQYFLKTYITYGTTDPYIVYYYFTVPSGMTQVRLTLSYVSGVTGSKVVTYNNATSLSAVSTSVESFVTLGPYGDTSGTNDTTYSLKVEFAGADSVVQWSGTCTLYDETDGSV